ncbi:hypothetical protein QID03_12970, partial [Alicyclobacillus sendaiensis PA2]|nr:hypothetical protein [Alicyclobacillus sendaiensis PA2]
MKWTTDGHTVHRMPAVAAPTWSEPDVVSGEHAWVVGEHAEREDATLAVALDSERLSRPEFQALLGYVFASLPDEPLRRKRQPNYTLTHVSGVGLSIRPAPHG